MEIVKKNLMSIICGVLALAAVVTAFFPLGGFWTDLHTRAQARTSAYTEAKGLISKERTLPVVTPAGEPEKLQRDGQPLFPNQKIIDAAKTQLGVVKENSDRFLKQAVAASERKPLVENVLPGVTSNPAAETEFRRQYASVMNTTAASISAASTSPFDLKAILKAVTPPTGDDVTRAATEVRKDVETAMLQKGPNGQELNRAAVNLEIEARTASLYDDLKQRAAEHGLVYVNPDGSSFTLDPNFQATATPTLTGPTAIFWAQVNYWVQEEFARAVFDVNSNALGADGKTPARNILEVPVKHIISVRVPPGFTNVSMVPQQVDPNTPPPPGTPFDRAAALTKDPTASMTGRKSGGIIDVVLYDVELAVELERLPYVLERLSQNRYLTVVLVRSITPIDSSVQKSQGYLYGDKPCVRVSLRLEQVFMREWMLRYMPPGVMSALGVAPPAAPAAPTP